MGREFQREGMAVVEALSHPGLVLGPGERGEEVVSADQGLSVRVYWCTK